jgi:hypothetical protein
MFIGVLPRQSTVLLTNQQRIPFSARITEYFASQSTKAMEEQILDATAKNQN